MFGSTVLEIAIGLVFVYLVLSLVVTAASEFVASLLKWRSENLFAGIKELLRDPEHQKGWAAKLYAHPMISALSLGKEGSPSYIPSRTFAVALLDLIAPASGGVASVLAQAEAMASQPTPPLTESTADPATIEKASAAAHRRYLTSVDRVEKLGLPIGWQHLSWTGRDRMETAQLWITRVLGWLLTVCAVSLGAPFWFDLLNRFMNIRSAGKAPEDEPKDPKEVPQPAGPGGPP